MTPVKLSAALPDDFWNIEGGMEGEGTEDEDLELGDGSKVKGHEPEDTMEVGAEALNMDWKVKGQEEEEPAGREGAEEMESEEKSQPVQLPEGLVPAIAECLEELKKCIEKAGHTIVSQYTHELHACLYIECTT